MINICINVWYNIMKYDFHICNINIHFSVSWTRLVFLWHFSRGNQKVLVLNFGLVCLRVVVFQVLVEVGKVCYPENKHVNLIKTKIYILRVYFKSSDSAMSPQIISWSDTCIFLSGNFLVFYRENILNQ